MEMQYYKSVWGDIKNSPGWLGKICKLALLNLIPIFGQIVTFAYLYGWAREIAWGTHAPLPDKIIANDDGTFWRRGWFALVLTGVFALVPSLVVSLGDFWRGLGYSYSFFSGQTIDNPLLVGFGSVLSAVGTIGIILLSVLALIGNMRVSIYDRLSSGFQLSKLWKMLRHDTRGMVKVLGTGILLAIIFGLVLSLIFLVLVLLTVSSGIAALANAGYLIYPNQFQYLTQTQSMQVLVQLFASAGVVGFFSLLIGTFLALASSVFIEMVVVRSMGYWTMQFDVPRWGGQDDPMPFELYEERATRKAAQAAQAEQASAKVQQTQQAPVAPVTTAPEPEPVNYSSDSDECIVVQYDEPVVVGASFIMSPEEIAEAEAGATAANDAEDAAEPSNAETEKVDEKVEPAVAPEGFTFGYRAPEDKD